MSAKQSAAKLLPQTMPRELRLPDVSNEVAVTSNDAAYAQGSGEPDSRCLCEKPIRCVTAIALCMLDSALGG